MSDLTKKGRLLGAIQEYQSKIVACEHELRELANKSQQPRGTLCHSISQTENLNLYDVEASLARAGFDMTRPIQSELDTTKGLTLYTQKP